MIKKYAIVLLAIANPLLLLSQQKDFGAWYSINLEKKISKKFDFDINSTFRTHNNASQTDQFYLESGLSYKLNKYLAGSINYRWIYKHEEEPIYDSRHRWFADLKLSYPVDRLKFSARFRYQNQYKVNYDSDKDKVVAHYGRVKISCNYNISKFPVNPYISLEYFYPLFNNEVTFADKKRFTIGTNYNITKKHVISLEYIFQRDYLPLFADMNIISLSYQFSF